MLDIFHISQITRCSFIRLFPKILPKEITWVGLNLGFFDFLFTVTCWYIAQAEEKQKSRFDHFHINWSYFVEIAIRENNQNIDFIPALSRGFSFLSCFPFFKNKMFLTIQIMRHEKLVPAT